MISTGDTTMDACFGGYLPGHLYVVGGPPGSGKTSWLRLAIRAALDSGKSVHLFDLESVLSKEFSGSQRFSSDDNLRNLNHAYYEIDDLVVFDALHRVTFESASDLLDVSEQYSKARWVTSFTQTLLELTSASPTTAFLMSWQTWVWPSPMGLPSSLAHAAEVYLSILEPHRVTVVKNRFGPSGQCAKIPMGYILDSNKYLPKKTLWERLDEDLLG